MVGPSDSHSEESENMYATTLSLCSKPMKGLLSITNRNRRVDFHLVYEDWNSE